MKYCSQCQTGIEWKIPAGDNRHRFVCPACDIIFYENPRIVAGTIPVHAGKILLCRRAIEPRKGYWTLPAGFMENGESTEEAALRETREEANAEVVITSLFSMITVPHIAQVHIFFAADLPKPEFSSGDESLEVKLFAPKDIPWNELAFPTVGQSLKLYLENPTPRHAHVFDILPHQALSVEEASSKS